MSTPPTLLLGFGPPLPLLSQTSAKANILWEIVYHGGQNIRDTTVGGRCHKNIIITTYSCSWWGHIVSWFDLETCSKVIKDGTVGQNTYDFLLVFFSDFVRISYCFFATVDFMPKWPCWATVTSKWQRRSIQINSKIKSPWDWAKSPRPTFGNKFLVNPCITLCGRLHTGRQPL